MTRHPDQAKERSVASQEDGAMQLILSMADTTWRMFTPPLLTVPAGLYGDLKLDTKPWLTIAAAVAGLGLSVLLVRLQLRGAK